MRRLVIAIAACLMFPTAVLAEPVATPPQAVQHRWMGDATCAGWRNVPASYESIQKGALLNWVLGFLSGRSAQRGDDILLNVEASSVAAWLDDYCQRNPLNYLVAAAFDLEEVLMARQRS